MRGFMRAKTILTHDLGAQNLATIAIADVNASMTVRTTTNIVRAGLNYEF